MTATDESAQRPDDGWYVIERSSTVGSVPLSRYFFNETIVLVRSDDRQISALEDRCPHQGVPLSHGRMGPHGLMCRYHGWSFDARGHCTHIPGASTGSVNEIRVQSYRVRELDGLVWISNSGNAAPPRWLVKDDARESIFLWEKRFLQPASQIRRRLADFTAVHSGVMERVTLAPLGCQARMTLCITPETQVSTRVFAFARLESRWLPHQLAQILLKPRLQSSAAQTLLRGDLFV
jgi:nitrite reductase/ring-hydroxylating ferredoxin subunit